MNEESTAKELPPVQSEIDSLEGSIEALSEFLNELELRLKPVLEDSSEDKLEEKPTQGKDACCDLENSIYSAKCKVQKNVNKIIEIKKRLCI